MTDEIWHLRVDDWAIERSAAFQDSIEIDIIRCATF